jgi:amino acid adenylation domain-containing protein
MTLIDLLKNAPAERGVSVWGARRWTFHELLDQAEGVAGGLRARGHRPGQPVLLLQSAPEAFLPAFWGTLLAGGTAVPLADARGASPSERRRVERVLGLLGEPLVLRDEDAPSGPRVHEPDAAHPALVQFSSGSTGHPKGVVLEHRHLLTNVRQLAQHLPIRADDLKLTWMPHYHDMGLIGCHLLPTLMGMEQLRMRPEQAMRDLRTWLAVAQDSGATLLSTTNFALARACRVVADFDLSRVRHIFNGAEPISPAVCRRFCELSGLPERVHIPMYGLAEATVGVAAHRSGGLETRHVDGGERVLIGALLPELEARIEDGELQLRGPNVFERYWNDPQATAAAFQDGWLKTGDRCELVDGRLLVVGRLKDVICVNGRNLHADDVERVAEQVPGVRSVVAHPAWVEDSEALGLRVQLGREAEAPALWALRDRVRAEFGVEPVLVPVDGIPRTTSGKKQRSLELPRSERTLRGLVGAYEQLTGRPAQADVELRELGTSSIEAVQLLARLEQRWGVLLDHGLLREASLRTLAQRLDEGPPRRVAPASQRSEILSIQALACRLPGADSLEALSSHEGFSTRVEPLSPTDLDPAEAAVLDPQQKTMLALAQDLASRSALAPGSRTGVFVGAGQQAFSRDLDLDQELHPGTLAGNLLSGIATRLAHRFDLKGPALTVDTACSSSLVALHLAARSIREGECDQALVGGINLNLDGPATRLFELAGALSPSGVCRPFSDRADGTVPADAAVLLVLGRGPGLAGLLGTAVNNDGASLGVMAPNPAGQEEVLRSALERAGVEAGELSYVEAHGSGTRVGDAVEASVLRRVYGEVPFDSVKGKLGHSLAAAGLAGLLHALTKLEDGQLAGVSSFGFGGTNAHVVLRKGHRAGEARAEPSSSGAQEPPAPETWLHRVQKDPAGGLSWTRVQAGPTRLRRGARYLVTGGSGALGTSLCAWLRERWRAEVVSLSRRDGLDLTDAQAVRRILPGLGRFDGAFHLAGSLERPEVKRQALENLLALDTDWWCLFSSISATLPGLDRGIEDYARANAWLDEQARRSGRMQSIAWPPFAGGGLAGDRAQDYRERGIPSITPELAWACLELALGSDEDHVVVLTRPEPDARRELPEDIEDRLRELVAARSELAPEDIDLDARLVELGIDSVAALDLVEDLEELLGYALPSTLAYEHPTLSGMLGALGGQAVHEAPAPETGDAVLPAQETFLVQRAFFPDIPGNVLLGCTVRPAIEQEALEAALAALGRRHPALCSRFVRQDPAWSELPGQPPALSWGPFSLDQVHAQPFDLERGPVLRCFCDGRRLVLNGHHAALDAWSLQQALRDLLELVQGVELPTLRSTWPQARAALRAAGSQGGGSQDAAFWEARLAGAPPLNLEWAGPVDAPTAAPVGFELRNLSRDQTAALAQDAREAGVSLPAFVLAAYMQLLFDRSGQHDLTVRVAQGRRELKLPDVRRLVGSFADSLPVRVQLRLDEPLADLAARVAEELAVVRAHGSSSARGLASLGSRGRSGPVGLAPAGFSFPLVPAPSQVGQLQLSEVLGAAANGFTRLGLVCWLFDGQLHMSWNFPHSHLTPATVAAMASDLQVLLTEAPQPQPSTLHGRVLKRCRQHPDRRAVGGLSYRDLDRRSAGLAQRLVAEGGAGRVAILAHPSAEAVVCLLGILRTGAHYVPLDPSWPDARIQQVLAQAQPDLTLTLAEHSARLPGAMVLDESESLLGPDEEADLAYVMFTSGSTGRPKGVVVPHSACLGFQSWVKRAFGVTERDRFVQTSSLGFGGSVRQIFAPLLSGGSIHPVPREIARDPEALLRFLEHEGITVWNSVPSLWGHLMGAIERLKPDLSALRWCLIGGEAVPASMVRRWRHLVGDSVRLANLYGSTETLVNATWFEVVRDPEGLHTPIGWPRGYQQVHLLDEVDGVGELAASGCIARGYLDPEQTAQAFIELPGVGLAYRTGDLGRRQPDGSFVYLGRKDSQVQIHGNRVELSEIEHVLMEHVQVRAAAVVYQDGQLSATVEGPTRGLREWVAARLPHYMVPHRFHSLDRLPRNAAGKTDRRSLRLETPASPSPVAAASSEELAGLFRQVLRLERKVGPDEDFFALGGDSVRVLELLDLVRRRFGKAPSPLRLYGEPTVAALARMLELSRDAGPVGQVHSTGLSAVQRGFYLAHRARPDEAPTWRALLPLRGPLDLPRFLDAVRELIRRHPMLRTVFEDGPSARVLEEAQPWVQVDDLSMLPDPLAALEQRWQEERGVRLRMDHWPLCRLRLCRLGPEDHRLLLTAHHIVADGWSAWLMMAELLALHEGHHLPAAPAFSPPAEPPHDPWWAQELAGLEQPSAPIEPQVEASISLEPGVWEGLQRRARRSSTSAFVVVLSALFTALAECTGRQDMAVGVAHAARPPEAIGVVGPFARGLPIRSRPGLERVSAAWRRALPHADAPPSSLLATGDPERLGRWFLTWMDPSQVPAPATRLRAEWSRARYAFSTAATRTEALVGCLVQDGLHLNLHGGALVDRLVDVLERELRRLAAPDAALIVYLPEGLPAPIDQPLVIEQVDCEQGSSELVLIPRPISQVSEDQVREALRVTRAGVAGLGGLLPVRTGLAARRLGSATLTTGHAMTVVAMAWTVEALLERTGGDWSSLTVGLLGHGAIGQAVQAVCTARLGPPAAWLISDPAQGQHADLLAADWILGASSGGATLDVEALKPGTVVIDDSFPRCFSDEAAIARMERDRDVLLVHGGAVDAGLLVRDSPFPQAGALRQRYGADWLPGCHAEAILVATTELGPTVGLVTVTRALEVAAVAESVGWRSPEPHLGPWRAPEDLLKA